MAAGVVVAESKNNDVANSMSLVAEELVNDMLDREQEIQKAYSDKFKACVKVYGNETAVATMISTLMHEENGASLDFVRKLLPKQPLIEGTESKMHDGMADDETASNIAKGAFVVVVLLGLCACVVRLMGNVGTEENRQQNKAEPVGLEGC